jgi:putative DNA primase/helicase
MAPNQASTPATPVDSTRPSYGKDTTPPRPIPPPVRWEALPAELPPGARYVGWQYERRNGQWTKPPLNLNVDPIAHASHADPRTWTTRAAVQAAYAAGLSQGVGVVLTDEDRLAAIDLDKVRNPTTKEIVPWALAIVHRMNTYTEVSPSGTGLRLLFLATLPPYGRRKGPIETYETLRYMTLTGHHLSGTPTTIEDRQAELEAWHAEVWPASRARANPLPPQPLHLDDEDLRTRMLASSKGPIIARLMAGDTSAHGDDQSSADLALCNYLAFWFGRDPARMDRVFRSTALYRAKWDTCHYSTGETYGAHTVAVACSGTPEVYTPPAVWAIPLRDALVAQDADSTVSSAPPSTEGLATCPPCRYQSRLAELEAELMVARAREAAATAALDQAQTEIGELKADKRGLLDELAEAKRQQPQAFIRRVVDQVAALEASKKTRGIAVPFMVLLAERQANVEAGKPAETPLPWRAAEREKQFGRDADTLRKAYDRLEVYKFVDRDYEPLGVPGEGDYRRTLLLSVASDVPTDIPDALRLVYQRMHDQEPLRERPKRSQGCAPCKSAQCPDHPTALVQQHVRTLCVECGREAAPDHVHEPRQPGKQAPPAVMHLRLARVDFTRPKNSVESPREDVGPKNSVEAPATADLLAQAETAAQQLAVALEVDALPPLEFSAVKLKILHTVVTLLQAGRPAPAPQEVCDTCFKALPLGQWIRCDGCAHAEVA